MELRLAFVLGLATVVSSGAAQLSNGSPTAVVQHTCSRPGSPASCAAEGPRAIVLRSNSEQVASYPLSYAMAAVQPADAAGGFVSRSAASYQTPVLAVGSIAAGFGQGLATTTEAAAKLPLPTLLGGTTVTVTDSVGDARPAQLFYVSPVQVNYLIPPESKTGDATVRVVSGDGTVSNGTLTLATVAPGLISANSSGAGVAAAQMLRIRSDGSQENDVAFQYDNVQAQFVPKPIDPGPETDQVILLMYGTGFQFRSSMDNVKVRIGGVDAEVLYAGPQNQYAGLDQLNVRLPHMLGGRGELDVELTVDGRASNMVTIATGGPMITPPPHIASLTPNSGVVGQIAGALTIAGQNLAGVTGVEFFPAAGITVSHFSAAATLVTAQVAIAADAAAGARQVAVISPSLGRSNKVTFTVTVPGPRITSLSPDNAQTGQTITLTVRGDNLAGATAIQFTPSTGITVGNLAVTTSSVTAQITIAGGAPLDTRSIAVISPLGTSNTLPFTIRQATPQIASVNPAQGSQGQVIATFTITGQNLDGATAIAFAPPTGISVGNIVAGTTSVTAQLTIDASAPLGMRAVSVITPNGISNTVDFSIIAAVPQITSLDPDSGYPGQTISSFTIGGHNLAGVTAIAFAPPTGITVGGLSATSGTVTAQVTIASNAPLGARSVSAVYAGGVSNALTFSVEAAAPQITGLNPNSGNAGQTISTFTVSGQNLSGVTAIVFSPSTGISVSNMAATGSSVTAQVVIAAGATVGPRSVSAVSPAGTSNTLTFTINQPLSPIPAISSVVLHAQSSGPMVTISGSLKFTDGAADIVYTGAEAGSAKLKLSCTTPSASCSMSTYGSFLNKPGQTSGTIDIDIMTTWNVQITGSFTVQVSLVDGAGHESNVVSISPGTWYCLRLDRGRDGRPPRNTISEAVAARRRGDWA